MKTKFIVIVLIIICIAFSTKVQAYSIGKIITDAQNFVDSGNSVEETINTAALKDTSNFLYRLLLAIGVVVAAIVGIVLGIQFMVSSAEDKAKVKEAFIAYVISCVVLFGAYGIWSIVISMAQDITEETVEAPNVGSETYTYPGHQGHLVQIRNGRYFCVTEGKYVD